MNLFIKYFGTSRKIKEVETNLDAKLRVTMRTEIRRIQQEAGITAIYVTHDQSEAMALSDQIIIMDKGEVTQIGTPPGGLLPSRQRICG